MSLLAPPAFSISQVSGMPVISTFEMPPPPGMLSTQWIFESFVTVTPAASASEIRSASFAVNGLFTRPSMVISKLSTKSFGSSVSSTFLPMMWIRLS